MAKNQNQNQGPKLPAAAADLFASLLENSPDENVRELGNPVREKGKGQVSMQGLKLGILSVLRFSALEEEDRTFWGNVVSIALDALLFLPTDMDFKVALAKLEESFRAAVAFVFPKLHVQAGKKKEEESKYAAYEAEMASALRKKHFRQVLWMMENDPDWSYKKFEALKDRIDSKDRLEYVTTLVAEATDSIPNPIGPCTDEFIKEWRNSRKRIAYLENVFMDTKKKEKEKEKPGFKETIMAAIRGEKNPHVEAFRAKVKHTTDELDLFAKRHAAIANARRKLYR